jgi:hypothetical protein
MGGVYIGAAGAVGEQMVRMRWVLLQEPAEEAGVGNNIERRFDTSQFCRMRSEMGLARRVDKAGVLGCQLERDGDVRCGL